MSMALSDKLFLKEIEICLVLSACVVGFVDCRGKLNFFRVYENVQVLERN